MDYLCEIALLLCPQTAFHNPQCWLRHLGIGTKLFQISSIKTFVITKGRRRVDLNTCFLSEIFSLRIRGA